MLIRLFFLLGLIGLFSCQNQPYKQGEIMYKNFCSNCHMDNGQGLKGLYPPIANSDYFQKNKDNVPCIIRHGLHDTILVNGIRFDTPMAAIPQLKDPEIANIINYIEHTWGNGEYITIKEVQEALKKCP